ncbi:AraC family transcriptional regulator [Streptomyces sp. NPDC001584]|uniref:AraC family transcriptional regulator n=1 Tax=Streptomyces sp. NPDC001584 TaxID=3154521 RepID=UPI003323866A
MRPRTVLVTLYDGVEALDVTGPVGVLAGANTFLAATAPGQAGYRIATASPHGSAVESLSGVTLMPDVDLAGAEVPHTLLVPGGSGGSYEEGAGHPEVVSWLKENAPKAERVVSVCTGAFLLAEAGLLAGRRVTTHWDSARELAQRYPGVAVEPDSIFIRDGSVYTSAGVTAGIDLALALVEEDIGRDAALTVARYMVVFLRSQPYPPFQEAAGMEGRASYGKALSSCGRRFDHYLLKPVEPIRAVVAATAECSWMVMEQQVGGLPSMTQSRPTAGL